MGDLTLTTATRKNGGSLNQGSAVARPKSRQPDTAKYSGRLAVRIDQLRIERGLSVEDLAEKVTVGGYELAAPTLYHWLNGNRQPALDALPYLAKVLRCKLPDLLPPK